MKIDAARFRVQFMDEAPQIGSGWRIVSAFRGRRWVRVVDPVGTRAKIEIAVWRQLELHGQALGPRKRRRKSK